LLPIFFYVVRQFDNILQLNSYSVLRNTLIGTSVCVYRQLGGQWYNEQIVPHFVSCICLDNGNKVRLNS